MIAVTAVAIAKTAIRLNVRLDGSVRSVVASWSAGGDGKASELFRLCHQLVSSCRARVDTRASFPGDDAAVSHVVFGANRDSTALMWAAVAVDRGTIDVVEALLRAGADRSARTHANETAEDLPDASESLASSTRS